MFIKHIGREYWDVPAPDGGAAGAGGGDVDLGSVIQNSISEIGGGEGGSSGSAGDIEVGQTSGKTPEEEAEEKELAAIEQEIRTKNPAMRGNIAVHRHQAVLTRHRNQHEKALAEWAAKEKAWQEAENKYKQDLEGWGQYEWAKDQDIQSALMALDLSERDQKAFAELLLKDPRYAAILQMKEAKPVPSDRPRPNQRTQDGSLEYYDDDGVETLLNWHGEKLSKTLTEQITNTLRQEFEQKYGKVAEAYQATTVWNEAVQAQKEKLESMRANWKGFKEYEKDIKAEMMKREEERKRNPKLPHLSPEEAYIMVVPGKMEAAQAEREKTARERFIAEMKEKKAAAGGSVQASGVERTAESNGDRDLADIIRASLPRS